MDNVSYVALSAQVALRRNLDVIANNVANMNTVGFKSDRLVFAEALAKVSGNESKGDPVSFVADTHTWTDFSEGPVRKTGSDLDVALVGGGFLAVETPAGVTYTRDGRLLINPEGALVNVSGNPVLDADAAPIQMPPGTETVSIGRDGTISANGAVVAKLGVFANPSPEAMNKVGDSGFLSPTELEAVDNPQVIQGMVEDSNVSGVAEMTRLVNVSRAYGHADALADAADGLRKDAVAKLGRV